MGWRWASQNLGKVTAWLNRYLGHAGGEKVSGRRGFNERTISKGQRQSVPRAPAALDLSFPKR